MMKHKAIFDWKEATQYLKQTKHLVNAQKTFDYWDPSRDRTHMWNGKGDFGAWLKGLPADAVKCWRNYKISCANMVAWNDGRWGGPYANIDVRGHSISFPGGKTSIWSPFKKNETIMISQWPMGPKWKQLTAKQDKHHAGWWYR